MAGLTRPTNEMLGRLAFLANTKGIIPNPIDATEIDRHGEDIANATTIIYTVPTGKKLFIASAWLQGQNSSAAAQYVRLLLRGGDDVPYLYIFAFRLIQWQSEALANSYHRGIEVTAGADVCLYSSNVDCHASGGFTGWLEDA